MYGVHVDSKIAVRNRANLRVNRWMRAHPEVTKPPRHIAEMMDLLVKKP